MGLGGVGLSCVMGAVLAGAGQVVAVDRVGPSSTRPVRSAPRPRSSPVRLPPPSNSFAISPTAAPTSCSKRSAGATRSSSRSRRCPRRHGRARRDDAVRRGGVVRGIPVRRQEPPDPRLELRLRGAVDRLPALRARLFLDGRLPIDRLVDRRIALDQLEDAFDGLRRARTHARWSSSNSPSLADAGNSGFHHLRAPPVAHGLRGRLSRVAVGSAHADGRGRQPAWSRWRQNWSSPRSERRLASRRPHGIHGAVPFVVEDDRDPQRVDRARARVTDGPATSQ